MPESFFTLPQRRQDVRKSPLGPAFARGDARRSWIYPVLRRGFHSCLVLLAKSPKDCTPVSDICDKKEEKENDCKKEKDELCYREKLKCLPEELMKKKPKVVEKVLEDICPKTCLGRGKCELPHSIPPPKMTYKKVTCPKAKYIKPEPCPSVEIEEEDGPYIEAKEVMPKKIVCVPPPMPKPPYGPIMLCPCPPPRKIPPGPCPCYVFSDIRKKRKMLPCPPKKKYPCPDLMHICVVEKKPCDLKPKDRCAERRKRKEKEKESQDLS